jgi:hypothetical protein
VEHFGVLGLWQDTHGLQVYVEQGAFAYHAVHPDAPIHLVDETLADAEAKPYSVSVFGRILVYLLKIDEDIVKLIFRDANAEVLHAQVEADVEGFGRRQLARVRAVAISTGLV